MKDYWGGGAEGTCQNASHCLSSMKAVPEHRGPRPLSMSSDQGAPPPLKEVSHAARLALNS